MPKFKIGDKISNGKIQYTVLDIQINSIGDLRNANLLIIQIR